MILIIIKFGSSPAWILAGGAHPTSFSYDVTPQQLCDFAEMADIECLLIDESTNIQGFKKELQWNEAYYSMSRFFR